MKTFRSRCFSALLVLLAACSGATAPTDAVRGTYVLANIDGKPLPVAVSSQFGIPHSVVSGIATVGVGSDPSRWGITYTVKDGLGGSVGQPYEEGTGGTSWKATGSSITLTGTTTITATIEGTGFSVPGKGGTYHFVRQ